MTALLCTVMDSCGTVCSGRDCGNSDGDNKLASFRRSIFSVTWGWGGVGRCSSLTEASAPPSLLSCECEDKSKKKRDNKNPVTLN